MGEKELSEEEFLTMLRGTKAGDYIVLRRIPGEDYWLLNHYNTTVSNQIVDNCVKQVNFIVDFEWDEDYDEFVSIVVLLNVGEYTKKYRRYREEVYLFRSSGFAKVDCELHDGSADADVKIKEFKTLMEMADASKWNLLHTMALSERMSRMEAKMDLLLTHIMYMPGGEGAVEAGEHFEMAQKI